jgi:hypothetical protein
MGGNSRNYAAAGDVIQTLIISRRGPNPCPASARQKRVSATTGPTPGIRAPAHFIVADDGQHAAMQDAELLANDLSDNEQRFNQHGQIRKVFDKLPDRGLELDRPDHATLRPELLKLPRRSFSMAMAFD